MDIKISFFQEEGRLDDRAIGSGVYIIELLNEDKPLSPTLPLYIGESFYMVKRCGEHLFEFIKNPALFGLIVDNLANDRFRLCFSVLESLPGANENQGREKEKDYISKYKPLTQCSNSDTQVKNKVKIVQDEIERFW